MRFLILLFFLMSCRFYNDTFLLNFPKLTKGKVVISSNSMYKEIFIFNENFRIEVNKYEAIYISYYCYFGKELTRFPVGCYLKPGDTKLIFSANLGLLTKCANEIHIMKGYIDGDEAEDLTKLFSSIWDPWIYNYNEVKKSLLGLINLNSVTKKNTFEISDLYYLYYWDHENPCFIEWYPSIQTFKSNVNEQTYRIEILSDGSYNGFIIP